MKMSESTGFTVILTFLVGLTNEILSAAGENFSEEGSDDDNSDGEDDTANDNSEQQSNQHSFPAEGIQVTISMPGKLK